MHTVLRYVVDSISLSVGIHATEPMVGDVFAYSGSARLFTPRGGIVLRNFRALLFSSQGVIYFQRSCIYTSLRQNNRFLGALS